MLKITIMDDDDNNNLKNNNNNKDNSSNNNNNNNNNLNNLRWLHILNIRPLQNGWNISIKFLMTSVKSIIFLKVIIIIIQDSKDGMNLKWLNNTKKLDPKSFSPISLPYWNFICKPVYRVPRSQSVQSTNILIL